ncbi:phosphatase PAP2 family protein [Dryocola sp. BD626]|uniref:phosphatase PAP2 family protein n=1 Tax=Dryocola sp. BD626 TaxID=3133273 RepID=UPI003F50B453
MKLIRITETETLRSRLKSYLLWMLPVSTCFFGLYPAINTFTTTRQDTLALWIPAELFIPFLPIFIWAYLSMYLIILVPVFFLNKREQKRMALELMAITTIAALIFLLFPARLGFVRQLPSDPLYRALFEKLLTLDKPHNLVPSLHVAWSCTVVLAVTRKSVGWFAKTLYGWLVLIVLSTLFVHQHHLLDVISGGLLSLSIFYFTGNVYEKNMGRTLGAG